MAVSVESQLLCDQNFRENNMSFFTDVTTRLTPITPTWMPRATPVPEEAPVKISKFMECLESKGLYLLQTLFTQIPELPADPEDLVETVETWVSEINLPLARNVSQEEAETYTKQSIHLTATLVMCSDKLNKNPDVIYGWLGHALLGLAHACTFRSVGPIIPPATIMGMMESAVDTDLPGWTLEDFANLVENRVRVHEQPLCFPDMARRILRGEASKAARDLVVPMALTVIDDIAVEGRASRGRAASWARKTICVAHDLSLQAVQEPGWLRDPIAPLVIPDFRQTRKFMNRLGGGLQSDDDNMEY